MRHDEVDRKCGHYALKANSWNAGDSNGSRAKRHSPASEDGWVLALPKSKGALLGSFSAERRRQRFGQKRALAGL
jgi:hypothetical protein